VALSFLIFLSFLSFFSGFSAICDEPASPQVYSTTQQWHPRCDPLDFNPLRRDLPATSSRCC
jgi:hypothetical protein